MEKLFSLIVLVQIFAFTGAAVYNDSTPGINMTEPCQYPVPIGLEKGYIPDGNIWVTSQINAIRGAQYGRLRGWRGGGAWTSGTTDLNQYFGVNLGYRTVISGIATQGRRGSNEFVVEYYLWFSSDNVTWTVYTNEYGTPLMFAGNIDDNSVVSVQLPYPIVARYVQINPQRWNRFISMRVELYGCRFDGDGATFDGESRISYDISGLNQFVKTRTDYIRLRLRTNQADGLVLFADGNQGDYLIVEMIRGRLYLNLDLGTTADTSGDTTMVVGSLLDDGQWHDVEIRRTERDLAFTVDRLTMYNVTNGDFYQLDLDKKIQLGGLDNFLQVGKRLISRSNFSGCMENVWFNYMNIIRDARMNQPRFTTYGTVVYGICQVDNIVPFTFPTVGAYLLLQTAVDIRLRVSFDFRSYNPDGMMFLHTPTGGGRFMMKIDPDGLLYYSIATANDPAVTNTLANRDPYAGHDFFTDGLWHSVYIDIMSSQGSNLGRINVTVDGRPDISNRQLTFTASTDYYLGGGDSTGGETGFLGCMRNLFIQGIEITNIPSGGNVGGVVNGSCSLQDRCDPNPCEHGGICSQDYNQFSCDCGDTGYEGAVCHVSKYFVSCEEAKILNPLLPNLQMNIDIDDSGPFDPFPVNCVFQGYTDAVFELGHDSMDETLVDGFPGPGSYVRPVTYNAPHKEELDAIIARAFTCEQYIRWTCYQSKLLSDASSLDLNVPSWGWWVGRTNMIERYWGGSAPDSGKCACGLKSECKSSSTSSASSTNPCNCDAGLASIDVFDDGYLIDKDRLPVTELHFGDTGNLGDDKWGKYLLGPLRCEGDYLYTNIVTFRKLDSTIEFPTFDAKASGDIRFQFMTTTMSGIFLQNTGPYDFIEVRLVWGNIIQFRFDVGNGIQTLEKMTAYPLNDNFWHTVHVERNRKQAMLRVDQQAYVTLDEPTDQSFRVLNLDSPLVIGAAVDFSEGYVGCMRALLVNGVMMDLRGKVERGEVTYGVASGCHPKCESSPCFNNGICVEWYSWYQCDCAYTPFRGWNCGREMGVVMEPSTMIRYQFDTSAGDISTDEENILIGFSTQEKHGQIMYIRNDATPREYISIEINNNGGVKVIVDVGFYRDEVNTAIPNVDLTNGQQHVVSVRRYNRGRKLVLAVDDYPPAIKVWDLTANTDTRLDNPKYIYFGRNETTRPGDGFKGCLFRAQWDNLYPIARVFQDPRGSNIYTEPNYVREDMCGFEEYTHNPDPFEFRPTPAINITKTTLPPFWVGGGDGQFLTIGDQALLGCCLGIGLILIILIIFLCVRYYYKTKRSYYTYEAKDAQYFDSPDYAIAAAADHQPEVSKEKEYYI